VRPSSCAIPVVSAEGQVCKRGQIDEMERKPGRTVLIGLDLQGRVGVERGRDGSVGFGRVDIGPERLGEPVGDVRRGHCSSVAVEDEWRSPSSVSREGRKNTTLSLSIFRFGAGYTTVRARSRLKM
jgi:hypothetical protein